MTDHRMNLDLITDMFGLLDRHGYTPRRQRAHRPGHLAPRRPGAHLRRLPGPPVRPLYR